MHRFPHVALLLALGAGCDREPRIPTAPPAIAAPAPNVAAPTPARAPAFVDPILIEPQEPESEGRLMTRAGPKWKKGKPQPRVVVKP
jgi:hypothetical protein